MAEKMPPFQRIKKLSEETTFIQITHIRTNQQYYKEQK